MSLTANPGTELRNAGTSSARTDSTLGATVSGRASIRTLLYLSVNVVASLSLDRAQPWGTDTSNVVAGGLKGTNTWLSGMSPAGFTSGAFGSAAEAGAAADEAAATCVDGADSDDADGTGGTVDVVCAGVDACPQAVATRTPAAVATA